MSRIAKAPITVPAGVEVKVNGQEITVKGGKGELVRTLNDAVVVKLEDGVLTFAPVEGVQGAWAQAGTARANVNNMVVGCLLYTSPSPRDLSTSRMPSSA
eukprot:TRINITY_DN37140_c0_g1_i1.p2 TRINITY_DN37140_c0_g1~~TRINITY_DN37140_c0_g1_i1.p2  ORF type:complete len:100 (-),score=13.26 TRINITY_DN37140_c0_g1_i1:70-369(-)